MMNSDSGILVISSDEDGNNWDEPSQDQIDWLSELLDTAESTKEDSDDVVFVAEISRNSTTQKKSSKISDLTKSAIVRDDSDDDCLILDKDPDSQVSVVDNNQNGSDELLIVGEKGQLACRDYPHSRHLCAIFPFSSSPHEKYCGQCHCYVCDSRAPCAFWGSGISKADHCHSTDKDETWKMQRKCFKQNMALPPASKIPQPLLRKHFEATISTVQTMHKSGPTVPLSQPLGHGTLPVRPVSLSTVHTGSSIAKDYGVPNIISRRPCQVSVSSNRPPHHINRMQTTPARTGNNNTVRRVPVRLGPHFAPPESNFKRNGGSSLNNRYSYYNSAHSHERMHKLQAGRTYTTPNHRDYGIHSQRDQAFHQDPQAQPPRTYTAPNRHDHGIHSQIDQAFHQDPHSQPPRTYAAPNRHDHGIHSQRDQAFHQDPHSQPPGTYMTPNHHIYGIHAQRDQTWVQDAIDSETGAHHGYSYQPNQSTIFSDQILHLDYGWLGDIANEDSLPRSGASQTPGLLPTSNPLPVTGTTYQSHQSSNHIESDLDHLIDSLSNQITPDSAVNSVPSQLDFVSAPDMDDEGLSMFDFENC